MGAFKDCPTVKSLQDGNDISLDIIAYRIDTAKAPYILQYVAKDDDTLRDTIVRTVARSKPRDIFGKLKTEASMLPMLTVNTLKTG